VTSVLIIDDDEMLSRLAAASLERLGGMRVITAPDGEEGIRLARAERPDCILLDVEMPGLSGVETLAVLRADPSTAVIPVIFVTGQTSEEEIRVIEALEPLGILAKPFSVVALPGQVRELLDTR
jgi:CheY-like chemotaxis protein